MALDDATRVRALKIYKRRTQANAIDYIDYINYVVEKFPFRIQTIRTDRGHEFQALFQGKTPYEVPTEKLRQKSTSGLNRNITGNSFSHTKDGSRATFFIRPLIGTVSPRPRSFYISLLIGGFKNPRQISYPPSNVSAGLLDGLVERHPNLSSLQLLANAISDLFHRRLAKRGLCFPDAAGWDTTMLARRWRSKPPLQ